MKLDHVTIRTTCLVETRQFFVEVFGLNEGPRPREIAGIPGYWLYSEDEPIVHIVAGRGVRCDGGLSGDAIDHVAFRLSDPDAFRQRLATLDVPHSDLRLPDLGEQRIFLRAPGGALIEAVFRDPVAS